MNIDLLGIGKIKAFQTKIEKVCHQKNVTINSKEYTSGRKKMIPGNSLVVQWLGHYALTAKSLGSIPGRGTKIPQATWCSQKRKKKRKTKMIPGGGSEM